jgi:methylmalonyl-CoA/ethylmalonyl-CoA epimerase
MSSISLPKGYEFHHLGLATASIEKEQSQFAALGYYQDGEVFVDPIQGVTGCFLRGPGPYLELLENIPGATTLTPWLNARIKIYHFAYRVADIEDAMRWARSQRAKVTVPPLPSVAFDQRLICFVLFRNGLMLEFIEKPVDCIQQ